MADRRPRKKPRPKKSALWLIVLLLAGVVLGLGWYWSCYYHITPELQHVLISVNDRPLKVIMGEKLLLHPNDRLRIVKIATNICFNRGVRLASRGLDANALLYNDYKVSSLLPQNDVLKRHVFEVIVKQYNNDLGHFDMVIEPRSEDWLERADKIIDADRRLVVLQKALEFSPEDDRIRMRLVQTYKSLKRWKEAADLIEKMVKNKPDENALFDLLACYEAMGDTQKVIEVLGRIARLNPEDIDVQYRLASYLEKAKKWDQAIPIYEAILPKMPAGDRGQLHKTLGYLYTESGQIKKAVSHYLKAIDRDREDVNVYYNLSYLYEKLGQKARADFFLGKAVSLKTDDLESRLKLAESLIKKEKYKEAESYLSDVLKQNPGSTDALLLKLQMMEKTGNKEEQKKIYYRILAADPDNETIMYNLGVLEYETGNLDKSLQHFEKLIRLQPEDAELHGFLFELYKKLGRPEKAYEEARTLIRLKPKEKSFYYFIFDYLNQKKQYEELMKTMENAVRVDPNDEDLRELLIVSYLNAGKEDLVIQEMEKSVRARPKNIKMLMQLAGLQEKKGLFDKAKQNYETILELSPGHKEAKQAYVDLLLQDAHRLEGQKKFEEALNAYQKILSVVPGHEEAEEAYLRLRIMVLPGERRGE